jgi:hypothetical protein
MQKENEKYQKVVYKDKEYVIIMYTYDSGYCELKESNGWNFILVPEAELSNNTKN